MRAVTSRAVRGPRVAGRLARAKRARRKGSEATEPYWVPVAMSEAEIQACGDEYRETVFLYQWGFGLFLTDFEVDELSRPGPLTGEELDAFRAHFNTVPEALNDPVNRIAVRLFAMSEDAENGVCGPQTPGEEKRDG